MKSNEERGRMGEPSTVKRAVVKQELVALTGDGIKALILNQFIYWSMRVNDFDKFLNEEKKRAELQGIEMDVPFTHGWIFKAADELSDEIMMGMAATTTRRYIKSLVDGGWLAERKNPKNNWSRTLEYRVNISKIQQDLFELGYVLDGYTHKFNVPNQYVGNSKKETSILQNEGSTSRNEGSILRNGGAISEITTEITTEITASTLKAKTETNANTLNAKTETNAKTLKDLKEKDQFKTYSVSDGNRTDSPPFNLDYSPSQADTTTRETTRKKHEYTEDFEDFMGFYPSGRKKNKLATFKAWNARLKEGVNPTDLILAAKHYALECNLLKKEEKYIRQSETFLGPNEIYLPYVDWVQTDVPDAMTQDKNLRTVDEWRRKNGLEGLFD